MEPWKTSDLVTAPNIPDYRVTARRGSDKRWRLFFVGTRNEVFQNESFISAYAARSFFKAQRIKAQDAAAPKCPLCKRKCTALEHRYYCKVCDVSFIPLVYVKAMG